MKAGDDTELQPAADADSLITDCCPTGRRVDRILVYDDHLTPH